MDAYTATGIAEGFVPCDDPEMMREAWQYLVDTGLAYRLQGWFGRTAEDLIEQGVINRPRLKGGDDGQLDDRG